MTEQNKMLNARNRPRLIVQYIRRPAQGSNTSAKGFGKTGEWDAEETIDIVTDLKTRHLTDSQVILDILQAKVVKNRFEDANDDQVYKHYMEKYSDRIQHALSSFIRKHSANMATEMQTENTVIEAEVVSEVKPIE